MADEADPRQAHSVALTTSEGLIGVWVGWSGGGPGLSPLSFFSQSFTTGGLKVISGGLVDSLAQPFTEEPFLRIMKQKMEVANSRGRGRGRGRGWGSASGCLFFSRFLL